MNNVNWLCRIFGHTPQRGYAGGEPCLIQKYYATDGIDRIHVSLFNTCEDCKAKIPAGRIIWQDWKQKSEKP